MAQECGFFNAELVGSEYDRVYNAEQFAAYFASFIANGVFGNSMGELIVLENQQANMSVDVSSGQGWINGWWYRNTEELNLPIALADGVLNRKDIVVLRWGNSERDMWLQVIQGEPSGEPIAPEIRRDADYYDLKLCEISIPAGTSRITQSLITDTRLDNNVCGLVTGVVDQIDTTQLFIQFQAAYADWKNTQEADFEEWFAEIQDILDENVAAHLQNEIDALDELEYTSSDELNPTSSESVGLLESGETAVSRWQKVSKMFKNIRYVLSRIGNTDIASIGSTITLAISNLSDKVKDNAENLQDAFQVSQCAIKAGVSQVSFTNLGDAYITYIPNSECVENAVVIVGFDNGTMYKGTMNYASAIGRWGLSNVELIQGSDVPSTWDVGYGNNSVGTRAFRTGTDFVFSSGIGIALSTSSDVVSYYCILSSGRVSDNYLQTQIEQINSDIDITNIGQWLGTAAADSWETEMWHDVGHNLTLSAGSYIVDMFVRKTSNNAGDHFKFFGFTSGSGISEGEFIDVPSGLTRMCLTRTIVVDTPDASLRPTYSETIKGCIFGNGSFYTTLRAVRIRSVKDMTY